MLFERLSKQWFVTAFLQGSTVFRTPRCTMLWDPIWRTEPTRALAAERAAIERRSALPASPHDQDTIATPYIAALNPCHGPNGEQEPGQRRAPLSAGAPRP